MVENRYLQSHHFGIETLINRNSYGYGAFLQSHHFGIETNIFQALTTLAFGLQSHHFGIETYNATAKRSRCTACNRTILELKLAKAAAATNAERTNICIGGETCCRDYTVWQAEVRLTDVTLLRKEVR